MPVLKQLRVDDVTYDTVGEASVTQVVSTGTKIATIAIDGTSTDLYAPSGGTPETMTDAEVEAAVEAAEVSHTITVSGATAYRYIGNRMMEQIASATYGETVTIDTNSRLIQSISSTPTVTFETVASSDYQRQFVMPNEAITITVTTSGGGGGND